jgi:hypothetical protein
VVDTVLVDQEMVYAPRLSNDRLLLGLKGSLNEYELDLLRQRSVEARREKARRGELIISAPVGYIKGEDQHLEKDPDLRVQQSILLVFRKFAELGSVRQTLMWFLEHGLEVPTRTPSGKLRWKRPVYRSRHRMLTSPVYGGAYSYGKTEHFTGYEGSQARHICRRKPREQWLALIRALTRVTSHGKNSSASGMRSSRTTTENPSPAPRVMVRPCWLGSCGADVVDVS